MTSPTTNQPREQALSVKPTTATVTLKRPNSCEAGLSFTVFLCSTTGEGEKQEEKNLSLEKIRNQKTP